MPNKITVTVEQEQGYERVPGKTKDEDTLVPAPPNMLSLEQLVDADIDKFEVFFKGLGNDSLANGERAAIKTYLWFKTHPETSDGEETSS